jgi:hypothetical protein
MTEWMKWDPEQVKQLLEATIEEQLSDDGSLRFPVIRFQDALMKYEIRLYSDSEGVFIAADPDIPITGLPYFEISLPCKRLAPVPRTGMPTGLGLFSGESWKSLRFTITRRGDGRISLSGAWP